MQKCCAGSGDTSNPPPELTQSAQRAQRPQRRRKQQRRDAENAEVRREEVSRLDGRAGGRCRQALAKRDKRLDHPNVTPADSRRSHCLIWLALASQVLCGGVFTRRQE